MQSLTAAGVWVAVTRLAEPAAPPPPGSLDDTPGADAAASCSSRTDTHSGAQRADAGAVLLRTMVAEPPVG
jgi:hypothetical protein